MSVLTSEEFRNTVEKIVGDNLSDENLKIMEDLTDTYNDLQSTITEQSDYKTKYEENDKQWREKYASRFLEGGTYVEDNTPSTVVSKKSYKYEDLFNKE